MDPLSQNNAAIDSCISLDEDLSAIFSNVEATVNDANNVESTNKENNNNNDDLHWFMNAIQSADTTLNQQHNIERMVDYKWSIPEWVLKPNNLKFVLNHSMSEENLDIFNNRWNAFIKYEKELDNKLTLRSLVHINKITNYRYTHFHNKTEREYHDRSGQDIYYETGVWAQIIDSKYGNIIDIKFCRQKRYIDKSELFTPTYNLFEASMNASKSGEYQLINKYISLFVPTDIRIMIDKYLMIYRNTETFQDEKKYKWIALYSEINGNVEKQCYDEMNLCNFTQRVIYDEISRNKLKYIVQKMIEFMCSRLFKDFAWNAMTTTNNI